MEAFIRIKIQLQEDIFWPYDEDSVEYVKTLDQNKIFTVNLVEAISLLPYKAVFWIWMKAMAESFTSRSKKGEVFTDKQMHDLMCHRFLGYTEAKRIGKTTIMPALRTLTYPENLSPDQWYALLRQMEEWMSEYYFAIKSKPPISCSVNISSP